MESVRMHYKIDKDNFTAAGEASSDMKNTLKRLAFPADAIRRAAICMYEGEINMVIHAEGGCADVEIDDHTITMVLKDKGPGIADIPQAMQEGFSTATEIVRDLGFGAGMGLPNMKRYSDEMTVDSIVGEGTTVTMVVYLGA